jgi:transposase
MEACGGAHSWARKPAALGHTVKLMAPRFVKPYMKTRRPMRRRFSEAVALANKNARIVWALITGEAGYRPGLAWRVPRRESAGQPIHFT